MEYASFRHKGHSFSAPENASFGQSLNLAYIEMSFWQNDAGTEKSCPSDVVTRTPEDAFKRNAKHVDFFNQTS